MQSTLIRNAFPVLRVWNAPKLPQSTPGRPTAGGYLIHLWVVMFSRRRQPTIFEMKSSGNRFMQVMNFRDIQNRFCHPHLSVAETLKSQHSQLKL